MHPLLPLLRSEVANRLKGKTSSEVVVYSGEIASNPSTTALPTQGTSRTTETPFIPFTQLFQLKQNHANVFLALIKLARKKYKGTVPNATNLMSKLTYNYTLDEIPSLISKNIAVLLYELTTQYRTFDIQCTTTCTFQIDENTYQQPSASLTFTSQGIEAKVGIFSQLFLAKEITITASSGESITITNYPRKSYAGIPRNTFLGSLIFKKDIYQTLEGKIMNDFVVINQLPFMEYLKGVVETNDQESLEKNNVMALIAKNYALFYLEKKNLHPNIPASSSYAAIDSPEMFQKYVGAGAEKTLKKRSQALEATKNQVILYAGTLPILPYFSCSAGFTRSAKEKRGRQDTPYLDAVYDFSSCPIFEGH
ncbi:MAG: hypothetical protein LBG52_08975 [Candidatus Peribacteria bacterium]|nr:hypothetical protein [Candidatus Peribacteria bacterium]